MITLYQLISVSSKKVILGYYVPWGKVEPSQVAYDKVTHINYGFGTLTDKQAPANITLDPYYDGIRLKELRNLTRTHNVKLLLSIGGWTGSQQFSTVAASQQLRTQFVSNVVGLIRDDVTGYGLDGVDLDWEYPGRRGIKCNVVSSMDSVNYLLLLKELRSTLDSSFPNHRKLITAAVRTEPFDGPNGKPMANVREFSRYFDFINLMTYDIINSAGGTTGPNAPFRANPRYTTDRNSFSGAIDGWIGAGFPASQITAGIAFYGHSFTATRDMAKDPTNQYAPRQSTIPIGDRTDAAEANPLCEEGTSFSGVYKYRYIVEDRLVFDRGYTRYWDNTTLTPWLFNSRTKHFISYDDQESVQIKVNHAACTDLLGLMFWDLSMDYNNQLLDSLNSIHSMDYRLCYNRSYLKNYDQQYIDQSHSIHKDQNQNQNQNQQQRIEYNPHQHQQKRIEFSSHLGYIPHQQSISKHIQPTHTTVEYSRMNPHLISRVIKTRVVEYYQSSNNRLH